MGGVCSNLASSDEPPASHDHFNHCCGVIFTAHTLVYTCSKAEIVFWPAVRRRNWYDCR